MTTTIIQFEYDKPIEVTKSQYEKLRANEYVSGLLVFRHENEKYYVKTWYAKYVNQVINRII